jgi:hypothetical protein
VLNVIVDQMLQLDPVDDGAPADPILRAVSPSIARRRAGSWLRP